MKKYVRATRYYVANEDFIPFKEQPTEGYTKLQAIGRIHREIAEYVKLFGGKPEDYAPCFHIMDDKMHYCRELDSAI